MYLFSIGSNKPLLNLSSQIPIGTYPLKFNEVYFQAKVIYDRQSFRIDLPNSFLNSLSKKITDGILKLT